MIGPRYIVKLVPTHRVSALRFRLYDTRERKLIGDHYVKRRNADKVCDRLNAEILKQSEAYRKAKDNG